MASEGSQRGIRRRLKEQLTVCVRSNSGIIHAVRLQLDADELAHLHQLAIKRAQLEDVGVSAAEEAAPVAAVVARGTSRLAKCRLLLLATTVFGDLSRPGGANRG